ncbi:MAG TPA: hypothetical protein VJ739_03715, partial [Gemmataceae bacterium]|nr:hypothetical protein [Gemmataceae bacterium]
RGAVLADEFGGSGNDDLKLAVHRLDPASPLLVDGLIDGGPGHDRARHTANVGVLNCERDFLVP